MEQSLRFQCVPPLIISKCQMFSQSRQGHWTVVPPWPWSLAKMSISKEGDREKLLNIYLDANELIRKGKCITAFYSLFLIALWSTYWIFVVIIVSGAPLMTALVTSLPAESWEFGHAFFMLPFRFSTKVGLKRAVIHWAVKTYEITVELGPARIEN